MSCVRYGSLEVHLGKSSVYELVRAVCDASFTVRFESFKVMVGRLEKKRNLLV